MFTYRKEIDTLPDFSCPPLIEDIKKKYDLKELYRLALNENPYGCSDKVSEAVLNTIKEASLYPDGYCTKLRALLSEKYSLKEDQFMFGCGTDEIISLLSKMFINKNDNCITASNTFSQYIYSVEAMGGKMKFSNMKNNGFDLDDILSLIDENTKIIFLANPNNPTGTIYSQEEQLSFIKKVPSNIVIVIDEAYAEFVDSPEYPNSAVLLNEYKNVIILRTFSKVYGLASFRIGYAMADNFIVSLYDKTRNLFNVSAQAQAAALAALSDDKFVSECVAKNTEAKNYLYRELDKLNLKYIPSQTSFLMVDLGTDSVVIADKLIKNGIMIRSGDVYNMNTYIRISIGTLEQMKKLIELIKTMI